MPTCMVSGYPGYGGMGLPDSVAADSTVSLMFSSSSSRPDPGCMLTGGGGRYEGGPCR